MVKDPHIKYHYSPGFEKHPLPPEVLSKALMVCYRRLVKYGYVPAECTDTNYKKIVTTHIRKKHTQGDRRKKRKINNLIEKYDRLSVKSFGIFCSYYYEELEKNQPIISIPTPRK